MLDIPARRGAPARQPAPAARSTAALPVQAAPSRPAPPAPAFPPPGPVAGGFAGGTIAIVSHSHPSVSKGGAEIAAYSLYLGLRSLGVDAIFIAVCPASERDRLLLGSEREHALVVDAERYDHFYQISSASVWRDLRDVLLRHRVGLVSLHHFLAIGVNSLRALAAETAIPFVVTLHEFLAICAHHGQMVTRPARRLCPMATPTACAACFPEQSRQQFAARQALIHGALSHAAAFVSPSHFLAERMVEWGLNREKFTVIENGLRHLPERAEPGRAGDEGRLWTFGYFGQITPFKGLDVLLDAIELLAAQPDIGRRIRIRVHGNLMGQTPEFTARFAAVFAATSQFTAYAGPYDNRDVPDLMSACDYVIVPSTWWENSPVVIQEAYAVGRPVICTGIGGMAEKVPNNRSGLHFRINDPSDLARTMAEAADDVLYQALCSGIPKVADTRDMAQRYLAIFARVAGGQDAEAARPMRRGRVKTA